MNLKFIALLGLIFGQLYSTIRGMDRDTGIKGETVNTKLTFSDLSPESAMRQSGTNSPTAEDRDLSWQKMAEEVADRVNKRLEEEMRKRQNLQESYNILTEKITKFTEEKTKLETNNQVLVQQQTQSQQNLNNLNQSYRNLAFVTAFCAGFSLFLSGLLAYKTFKKQTKYYSYKHNSKIQKQNSVNENSAIQKP